MGYAGIVNHTSDKDLQNVEIQYLKRTKKNENSDEAVYYFIKDVEPDKEILGNYGNSWDSVLNWVNETNKNKQPLKDWEKFLSYNLYDLGSLIKMI